MRVVEYLFVYGTLKRDIRGSKNYFLKKYASFIGKGFVHGKLYRVSYYPGMVLSKDKKDRVYGEIYKLKNPFLIFKKLDNYEGCSRNFRKPYEYRRVKTKAYMNDKEVDVWVYEFCRKVKKCDLIKSGIFNNL